MISVELVVLVLLICLCAGFVQRVSGFGFGIFAMLFLPYLMSTQAAAAAMSGLVSCVGSFYNAFRYRKHIKLKLMLPLICAMLVTVPIAVQFSASAPERILKTLLGVVLIVLSIYFLFFSKKIRIRPTIPNGVIAGALGGTLSGLFSTGGPPAVLYLVNATNDNLTYFATIQAYFFISNFYSAGVRVVSGLITMEVLVLAAIGVVGWCGGNAVGCKVFNRLDQDKLKRVIYIGMVVSGVLMIV